MIDLGKLRVSLTKNGYLKVADVIKRHPRWEVLDNLEGTYRGINIQRSQVSNILGADPLTGQLPGYWDGIREQGDRAVGAFTFVAIVLSHQKLIQVFQGAAEGVFRGYIRREDLTDKAYTNLVYAMSSLRLCEYARGMDATSYDLYRLIYDLRSSGELLRQLIASKLTRCGWLDPQQFPHSCDRDFLSECRELGLHRVFAIEWEQFDAWLSGDLEIDEPDDVFTPSTSTARRRPR